MLRKLSFCTLVVSFVALTGVGCGYHSRYMHEVTVAQNPRPAAGQALVVFIRPSGFASGIGGVVLDEQGRFVGDSQPSSHFVVSMPPGRHYFAIWAENTDVLQADLVAGKTYYVEVSPTVGWASARMHLIAIKPSSPNWPRLREWMMDTREFVSDFNAGQAYISGRQGDALERVRRAQEHLREYQGEDLFKRTLAATDGV